MKIFLFALVISSLSTFAADPAIVITTKNSYNGYATVVGRWYLIAAS